MIMRVLGWRKENNRNGEEMQDNKRRCEVNKKRMVEQINGEKKHYTSSLHDRIGEGKEHLRRENVNEENKMGVTKRKEKTGGNFKS